VLPLGLVLGHLADVVHVAGRLLRQDHDVRAGLDHLVHQNRIPRDRAAAERAKQDRNGIGRLCGMAGQDAGAGDTADNDGAK